jgi:hypothetical protein
MIYPFKCDVCEKSEEHWMKVSEYQVPDCCEQPMRRIFGHNIVKDLEPYLDENLTSDPVWVKSKQHRKELMREHGVIEKIGKGWY